MRGKSILIRMELSGFTPADPEQQRHQKLLKLVSGAVIGLVLMIGTGVTVYRAFNSPAESSGNHATSEVKISERYPAHHNIVATMFWVGETADETNDYISNVPSAWDEEWLTHFGGVDDPLKRCDNLPCSFAPQENPYYFALPYNDLDDTGNPKPEAELSKIPWYKPGTHTGESILKNRWIAIESNGKVVYAQWKDAGPFGEDDIGYVFGAASPKETRAGLDVSPAVNGLLGLGGRAEVSWRFVDVSDVPDGPWKVFAD